MQWHPTRSFAASSAALAVRSFPCACATACCASVRRLLRLAWLLLPAAVAAVVAAATVLWVAWSASLIAANKLGIRTCVHKEQKIQTTTRTYKLPHGIAVVLWMEDTGFGIKACRTGCIRGAAPYSLQNSCCRLWLPDRCLDRHHA
jgi:hypothetical protein